VKQGRPLNIALPLLLIATVFGAEEIQDKIKQAERAVAEGGLTRRSISIQRF